VTPPKTISTAEPNYTDEARQAHIQGTIILNVTVRTDGTAKVDKIVQGLGYGLDEKAIESVEKWRFVPGMKDGQPVDVQLPVTMNFKLY
jgi:protein TonB